MDAIVGLVCFVYLVALFAASLKVSDDWAGRRKNPVQILIRKLTGAKTEPFMLGMFIFEVVTLAVGGWLYAVKGGQIPALIFFGALLAATIIFWPIKK